MRKRRQNEPRSDDRGLICMQSGEKMRERCKECNVRWIIARFDVGRVPDRSSTARFSLFCRWPFENGLGVLFGSCSGFKMAFFKSEKGAVLSVCLCNSSLCSEWNLCGRWDVMVSGFVLERWCVFLNKIKMFWE